MKQFVAATMGGVMLGTVAWAAVVPATTAPETPGGLAKNMVTLKKLEVLPKTLTPQFQVLPAPPASKAPRYWYQMTVHFVTKPEWLDDLDLRCYVLLKAKTGPQAGKVMLLKGDVTLVNLYKGQHKYDFFVHPTTLLRFGDVDQVAVVISRQDQLIAMSSQPPNTKRWWEDFSKPESLVMRRSDTPWAVLNYDDYEQVKEASTTGAR